MSQNSKRGEVPVMIGDTEHALRYPWAALRELQEALKYDSVRAMLEGADKWGADEIPIILLAGLKRGSWPDITREALEEEIMIGDLESISEAIGRAFSAGTTGEALPDPLEREPAAVVAAKPTPTAPEASTITATLID